VSRDARSSPSFVCTHCHASVPLDASGTRHRNHCPRCLWSRHVDDVPGDRRARCGGAMEPLSIAVRTDGEWQLVHRCTRCHALRLNRIAGDDSPLLLVQLAVRPIARTPFPLDRLGDA
jgi:hypothetical protein